MPLKPGTALRKDHTQPSGRAVWQHRHYAELARMVRDLPPADVRLHDGRYSILWQVVANSLSDQLAETNPNFNSERFRAACAPGYP